MSVELFTADGTVQPDKMSSHRHRIYGILLPLLVVLAAGNLFYGAVPVPLSAVWDVFTGGEPDNPVWRVILLGSRLPQMITALLAGAALAVSGLLLQTLFRNPLAGPSILGISDGANLGVALVMLSRRLSGHGGRSHARCLHDTGGDRILLQKSVLQCDAAHNRYHGRLSGLFLHFHT